MSEQPESGFPADQVQAMIDKAVEAALNARDKAHADEMAALRRDVAGSVVTFVPTHAGGPENEIHPTWSLAQQTQHWAEMLKPGA